jgi:hypothetical protein
MRMILAGPAFVLAGLASPAVAEPAPDIVGKSVLVNWTENLQIQRADGSKDAAVSRELRIYISSAGRSFARGTGAALGSVTNEHVGPSGTSGAGGQWALRVDGRTIVVQASFGNWARNVRIELSPGGSSCSAQIKVGKEIGSAPKAFRSPISGMITEVHAMTVSGASCTAQQGNVFAN